MKPFYKSSKFARWFFWALIAPLSLGQLQKVAIANTQVVGAFYLHDVLIVTWLLVAFVQKVIQGKLRRALELVRPAIRQAVSSPSVLLLVWVCVVAGFNSFYLGEYTPLLYLLRLLTYLTFLLYLYHEKTLFKEEIRVGSLTLGFAWLAMGFVQFIFVPDLRSLRWLGFDDHYYRLTSSFFDPNFAGLSFILTLIVIALIYVLPNPVQKTVKISASILLGMIALFAGLTATYSRASFLSLVVVFIYWWITQQQKLQVAKVAGVALATALLTWAILPKPGGEGVLLTRTSSIVARSNTSSQYLAKLQPSEWLFGRGLYTQAPLLGEYENTPVPNHARVPDNILLLLLVAGGIPAVGLGVLGFLEWYRRLQHWHPAAPVLLVAVGLHALFNNSLLEPFLFLFLGLQVVWLAKTKNKNKTSKVRSSE